MRNPVPFLSLMVLLSAVSCQSQKSVSVSPELGNTIRPSPSSDFSAWLETKPADPAPTVPQSPMPPPTPTAIFDERWAVNYPASFSTAGFTIQIVRVEGTTKQYFAFADNWEFRSLYHAARSIILIWGHLSNDTDLRTFWDLNRCKISFGGKLYDDREFRAWGTGAVLSWDVPPHGILLGALSYAFGDRTPADLHVIDYDCPRPIQKTEPMWTDIGDPVRIHMSFNNPQWADPPQEIMQYYKSGQ
jgi:hypothetical protein